MRLVASLAVFAVFAGGAAAQPSGSGPSGAERARAAASARVTDDMLAKPDPADWLMYSRTYDAQRFSPLDQIDRGNVGKLAKAWSKPLPAGSTEGIPIVHAGVMYLTTPGSRDAAAGLGARCRPGGFSGVRAPNAGSTRVKALAIWRRRSSTHPAPMGEPGPVIARRGASKGSLEHAVAPRITRRAPSWWRAR
jgi:hypothetical protein